MAKVKILKPGETDIESTDIWRFAFNSDYPTYKIKQSGSVTLTTQTVGGDLGYYHSATVAHGLGYVPQTFVFADFSAYPPYTGGTQIKKTDITGWIIFYYDDSYFYVSQYADENNIYFYLEAPESGKVLTFDYIITLDEWQS